MGRVLGIGDNTVDIYVDQGVQFPGGNAVNVAVLTHRLGAEAGYLGCFGTDFLGELVRRALEAEGVDITPSRTVEGPNSWSRIRHTGNDRYFDGSHPSGRNDYQLVPADFEAIAGYDIAHSSVYSRLEDELGRIGQAVPILSFDYSAEYTDDYIAATAPDLTIAFLSNPEPSDAACRELARFVVSKGPRLAIVTRGEKGVLAFDGEEFATQGIVETEVVDTLGAGDGFISGFLMAHLEGQPIGRALARGALCAASVCRYRGAFGYGQPLRPDQPGLPSGTNPQAQQQEGEQR